MKKLKPLLLLVWLAPTLLLASPMEPSLRPLPLYARLHLPLFQVVSSAPPGMGGGSGSGGGGSSWGTQPSSNGCVARNGASTYSTVTLTAGAGIGVTAGDCQSNPIIALDTSVAATYAQGTASVPGTGSVGTFYFETDRPGVFTYPATDTEHWLLSIAAGAGAGSLFQTSATDTLAAITSTDDNTLVSDGSTWAKKALPDCDDSAGQHLNYDTATNAYSCGTSTGSSDFNPATTLDYTEEFVSGGTASAAIGGYGLSNVNIATGTNSLNISETSQTRHPGIIRLNSHATNDNSGESIFWSGGGGGNALAQPWYDSDWDLDVLFMPGSNSTAITNVAAFIGLSNIISSADISGATRQIGIRRDSDLSETTTWVFVTCNASGASGCNSAADAANANIHVSTITPVAGTWNRFRIRRRASGVGGLATVYFRVNDETEVTYCSSGCDESDSHIPTSNTMNFGVQYLTRTTTGVLSGDLDMMRVKITFGAARY